MRRGRERTGPKDEVTRESHGDSSANKGEWPDTAGRSVALFWELPMHVVALRGSLY